MTQRRLAVLWGIGVIPSLSIVLARTILFASDAKGMDISTMSAWLLPNIMPTLSLMVGVMAKNARIQKPEPEESPPRSRKHAGATAEDGSPASDRPKRSPRHPTDERKRQAECITRFFHRLTMALSAIYLIVVTAVMACASQRNQVQIMHNANLLMGPLQGLLAVATGVIFTMKREGPDEPRDAIVAGARAGT